MSITHIMTKYGFKTPTNLFENSNLRHCHQRDVNLFTRGYHKHSSMTSIDNKKKIKKKSLRFKSKSIKKDFIFDTSKVNQFIS